MLADTLPAQNELYFRPFEETGSNSKKKKRIKKQPETAADKDILINVEEIYD